MQGKPRMTIAQTNRSAMQQSIFQGHHIGNRQIESTSPLPHAEQPEQVAKQNRVSCQVQPLLLDSALHFLKTLS